MENDRLPPVWPIMLAAMLTGEVVLGAKGPFGKTGKFTAPEPAMKAPLGLD